MRLERFWRALRDFAAAKAEAAYMERVKHQRQCPRCRTWTSETDGAASYRDDGQGWHSFMTCRKCGHESRWNMGWMLPVLDDLTYGPLAK